MLQAQVCDCGVAALGIVLAHYGRAVPLAELRRQTGVTRDGITAGSLLRTARAHGLQAKGWRKEPDGLPHLGFPLIAHCGFNHFIVVEGMAADRLWINDPARGPGIMPRDQFDHAFTGVALSFAEEAPPTRPHTPVWRQVLAQRPRLPAGWGKPVAAAGAASCLGVAAAVLLGRAADGDAVLLPAVPALLLLGLLAYGRERWRQRWADAMADACFAADHEHLWRLPAPFFSYRGAAVAGRLFAGRSAAATIGGPLAEAALALLAAIPPLAASLCFDPVTGGGLLLVAVATAAGMAGHGCDRTAVWRGSVLAGMTQTRPAAGVFADIEAVRLGGRSDEILAETVGLQARNLHDGAPAVLPQAALSAVPLLIAGAPLAVALLAVGRTTPGSMVTLVLLALLLGEALSQAWRHAAAARQAYTLLLLRLDLRQEEPWQPPVAAAGGGLAARGLAFGYHRQGAPLLQGLDLEVRPGEAVGLAGTGGAGKSTLALLLSGLLQPWAGEVHGAPVLVDTRPMILEASLREAVRLWEPRHDDAAVCRALADAGLAGLLDEREGGLDMAVLAHGANLSGGQRIRLALARALLDDPSAVILDEAFDALDMDVELQIRAALRRRGCAVLVISHRETTLAACDRVLTLAEGRLWASR